MDDDKKTNLDTESKFPPSIIKACISDYLPPNVSFPSKQTLKSIDENCEAKILHLNAEAQDAVCRQAFFNVYDITNLNVLDYNNFNKDYPAFTHRLAFNQIISICSQLEAEKKCIHEMIALNEAEYSWFTEGIEDYIKICLEAFSSLDARAKVNLTKKLKQQIEKLYSENRYNGFFYDLQFVINFDNALGMITWDYTLAACDNRHNMDKLFTRSCAESIEWLDSNQKKEFCQITSSKVYLSGYLSANSEINSVIAEKCEGLLAQLDVEVLCIDFLLANPTYFDNPNKQYELFELGYICTKKCYELKDTNIQDITNQKLTDPTFQDEIYANVKQRIQTRFKDFLPKFTRARCRKYLFPFLERPKKINSISEEELLWIGCITAIRRLKAEDRKELFTQLRSHLIRMSNPILPGIKQLTKLVDLIVSEFDPRYIKDEVKDRCQDVYERAQHEELDAGDLFPCTNEDTSADQKIALLDSSCEKVFSLLEEKSKENICQELLSNRRTEYFKNKDEASNDSFSADPESSIVNPGFKDHSRNLISKLCGTGLFRKNTNKEIEETMQTINSTNETNRINLGLALPAGHQVNKLAYNQKAPLVLPYDQKNHLEFHQPLTDNSSASITPFSLSVVVGGAFALAGGLGILFCKRKKCSQGHASNEKYELTVQDEKNQMDIKSSLV